MENVHVVEFEKITLLILIILNLGIQINPVINVENQNRPKSAQDLIYETRATWLNFYAFQNESQQDITIQNIINAHLNTVFLIAPPIGTNRGWSTWNMFNQTLIKLKNLKISVHVWICNLYRTQGNSADFLNETERIAQKDWAMALLDNFPLLDGVHLDYIRYKYNNSNIVNASKMDAVAQTIRLINASVKTKYPHKFVTAATWCLSGRIRLLNDEIPEWYSHWFQVNPGNRWNQPSYNNNGTPLGFAVQQDPVTWINNSLLDYCISMEYDPSNSWWNGEVDIWNNFFQGNPSSIMMGLGWYIDLWNQTSVNETTVAHRLIDKITYGRAHNITGFSIFEFGARNNNDTYLVNLLAQNASCPFYIPAISYLDSSIFEDSENNPPILDPSDNRTNESTLFGNPINLTIFLLSVGIILTFNIIWLKLKKK